MGNGNDGWGGVSHGLLPLIEKVGEEEGEEKDEEKARCRKRCGAKPCGVGQHEGSEVTSGQ